MLGKIECVFRIDQQSEKKRRNGNRRVICNATHGIDAGRGIIRHRGVSDGSDGARPLWQSHSDRTEMFFAAVSDRQSYRTSYLSHKVIMIWLFISDIFNYICRLAAFMYRLVSQTSCHRRYHAAGHSHNIPVLVGCSIHTSSESTTQGHLSPLWSISIHFVKLFSKHASQCHQLRAPENPLIECQLESFDDYLDPYGQAISLGSCVDCLSWSRSITAHSNAIWKTMHYILT